MPAVSSGASSGAAADLAPIRVLGPASLSNLGPGFDALGLCISGLGDEIEAWRVETPGVHLEAGTSRFDWRPPSDPTQNTAAVAAAAAWRASGREGGLVLRVHKGIPLGSGIGGSAASAVAGAWAAHLLACGSPEKAPLVEAVLAGEEVASGGRHGDNVLPALFGGLVLVSSSDPTRYRRIPLPARLPVALLLPDVQILTRTAREMLPKQVGLRDAVHNAAALAFLVDAFRVGDWETVGRCIMADRLVEPVRAALVPCYDAVRAAALEAGALGCAITGSGPALFALAETEAAAARVLEAMRTASEAVGVPALGFLTEADAEGVRRVG